MTWYTSNLLSFSLFISLFLVADHQENTIIVHVVAGNTDMQDNRATSPGQKMTGELRPAVKSATANLQPMYTAGMTTRSMKRLAH